MVMLSYGSFQLRWPNFRFPSLLCTVHLIITIGTQNSGTAVTILLDSMALHLPWPHQENSLVSITFQDDELNLFLSQLSGEDDFCTGQEEDSSTSSSNSFDNKRKASSSVTDPIRLSRTEMKKKKIQHIHRLRQTFSRLLKNDFRKELPTMLINTLNRGDDASFVRNFFDQIFNKNCVMINHTSNHFGRPSILYNTPQDAASDVIRVAHTMPDLNEIIVRCRVIRRSDEEGCEVEIITKYSGTAVSSVPVPVPSSIVGGTFPIPYITSKFELYRSIQLFLDSSNRVHKLVVTASTVPL